MLSQTLLVCWALIVILLGFSFFRLSRRRRRPSKLNMKAGNASLQPAPAGLDPQDATTLDCWFNYNGHLWEAHEVLGVKHNLKLNLKLNLEVGLEISFKIELGQARFWAPLY